MKHTNIPTRNLLITMLLRVKEIATSPQQNVDFSLEISNNNIYDMNRLSCGTGHPVRMLDIFGMLITEIFTRTY